MTFAIASPMSSFPLPPPPFKSFQSFQWSPLLGSQLRLIAPFVLLKIKWSPLKSSPTPIPLPGDNKNRFPTMIEKSYAIVNAQIRLGAVSSFVFLATGCSCPISFAVSNSASFPTKGIKLDIICCYRARLRCETAHRGTTGPAKSAKLANVTKQLVTIHGNIERLFTVPYFLTKRSSRSSAHPLVFFKYTEGACLGVLKPPRKVPSVRKPVSSVPPSAVLHVSLTRCYRRERTKTNWTQLNADHKRWHIWKHRETSYTTDTPKMWIQYFVAVNEGK